MTTTKHIARALPALPPRIDPELKPLLTAIKEVLEVQVGHRGEDLDKAVTFRDLTDGGIANFRNQGIGGFLEPITNPGDQTTPPTPHSLTASGTFTNVLLSWGGGFRHVLVAATEIYRSTSDNLATASHIGSTSSFIYTDTVEPGSTNYYWVRFRSPAGVPGSFNLTDGTVATTSKKVSELIADLSDELNQSALSSALSTKIDKVDIVENSIATEVTNRIAGDAAEAAQRTILNTTVGEHSATILSHTGSISGISAEQYVKLDVNGNVSGYGIAANAGGSEFAVNADVFKIANGTSKTVPFVVTGGATYINTALIADASIDVAKIANLTVDMAQVTGTLTAAQFAAITISATDISTGFLSADRIDTSLLNVANMFLNGTLNVHNSTGAIAWGKTSGDDFTNTGLYFGRTGGQLRFNMGSSTSYIYFDGTTVQSVGTQSVAVAPAATTQYQSPGTYTRPLIGADVNRTITIKILGGGGGGGGGLGGAAGAGSSTTVRVKTQSGGTRATYTAGGGQGGPAGDWNYWYNRSPYTTWSSNGGPVNDYGGLGQPVSQGGIFVGSGGGTSRRNGSSASGNGAGGGGFGDAFDNTASASGAAGVYATYSVAVASTTDYIEITVGGGGGGGNKNYGQGDIKFGGNGASGAAQINLA